MKRNYELNTERMHLFTPNINVVTKIDISENPTTESIKNAIAIAVEANEVLNCRVELSKGGVAEYIKTEQPNYTVEQSNESWMVLANRHKSIIFDLKAGELVRFFILDGEAQVQLLIIMHHLAGDGLSAEFLIADIMVALSGGKLDYKPLRIISAEDFPNGSQMHRVNKIFVKVLNTRWRKCGRVFSYEDSEQVFHKYWDQHRSKIYCEQMSKMELVAIHSYAKKVGVSINSVLTTAFAKVYEKKAVVGFAVSIRDKDDRSMGNYASGISARFTYDKSKSFSHNTMMMHKRIYKKLKNNQKKYLVMHFMDQVENTLIDSVQMVAFGGYKNRTAKYLTHIMGYDVCKMSFGMSNMAKLDIASKYGKYDISNYMFVPPIIPNNCRVIGIATLGEQLCMTMHAIDKEEADKEQLFFEKAIEILKTISEVE